MPLISSPTDLGRITCFGPAHHIEKLGRGNLYIICSENGVNCWAGDNGAVLFDSKELAIHTFKALTGKEPIVIEK